MQLTELRTKALALKPHEHESLAHDLLDSLATESIDDVWLTEIDRRMEDAEKGKVTMVPYSQFREEIKRNTGW